MNAQVTTNSNNQLTSNFIGNIAIKSIDCNYYGNPRFEVCLPMHKTASFEEVNNAFKIFARFAVLSARSGRRGTSQEGRFIITSYIGEKAVCKEIERFLVEFDAGTIKKPARKVYKKKRMFEPNYNVAKMFEDALARGSELSQKEAHDIATNIVAGVLGFEKIGTLSMDKRWCGYGTWQSVCYANEYTFGRPLAKVIKQCLSGRITHEEEAVFMAVNYEEELIERISEAITAL